ncbi:cell envelope integrity protein TolA [Verminephrobacter eiseniae]|uniref:cell envelope integrity protein TolA n=1 Tax=Verminephrobacter eiseniae TaxID=364317 RepID=UPI002236FB5B|nr:cell envelope integrity protein TolA [Verminephrobacter eiseniae]MCW5236835.1 cell envelope integrity protein TolA [Verminephrobacter eiseniae]
MHAHDDRDQFAPPRPPAHLRAIVLAVLVHALLIGALTWGVRWKSSTNPPAVTAELWAAAPRQAAVEPAAPPAVPAAAPTARPDTAPAAQPPDTRAADIAIEREKKRQERERQEAQRRERLQKKKETEQRAKQLAEQEKQKKLAQDKLQAEQAAKSKAQAQEQEQRLARQREDNLRRLQGLAGASGGDNGTALRSAGPPGPSGSYSGKVSARVRPNIVYPDAIAGNPRATVEVRLSPDGTIVGKRLLQPSTSKAWDDAVLRALDKTETLPRDVDGRVPPSLVIEFRPQD